MKKTIAASWGIAGCIVFLALFMTTGNANAQQIFSRSLSVRDLAGQLKTPEDIARFMWGHFSFERDQRQFGTEEKWQNPDSFLETRKGDCEDFAAFAYEMLKRNGVKAFVFTVHGNGYGHAVCVFAENGRYNVINGTEVLRLGATDLREVATEIYPFWDHANVLIRAGGVSSFKVLRRIAR